LIVVGKYPYIKDTMILLFCKDYYLTTPKDESDIDLVIVSPDFKDKNIRERLELLGVASARIMEPVQALGATPGEIDSEEKSAFMREVLKHGKVAA
jgi:predicted nucleotidyltransferase